MHARVASVSGGAPERAQKGIERIKSVVAPTASKMEGFRGGYWLFDLKTGQGYGVTFFDSAENLAKSRGTAEQLRTEGIEQTGFGPQKFDEHEVIADTGQKVSRTATHARVTKSKGDPSKIDQLASILRDEVWAKSRETMPGFQGAFAVADRKTGDGLAVSLWDSEQNMRSSAEKIQPLREDTAKRIGAQIIAVEEYEIVARPETPVGAATG